MALLAPSLRGASFLLQDTDVADHCSFFFGPGAPYHQHYISYYLSLFYEYIIIVIVKLMIIKVITISICLFDYFCVTIKSPI